MLVAVCIGLLFGGYVGLLLCCIRMIKRINAMEADCYDLQRSSQSLSEFCMNHVRKHE